MLALSVGMYTGGGVYFNHKQRGMPVGLGALPHREYWLSLAAMAKDGVLFSRAKLVEARSRYAEGYQSIDNLDKAISRPPPRPRHSRSESEPEGEPDKPFVSRDLREVKSEVSLSTVLDFTAPLIASFCLHVLIM